MQIDKSQNRIKKMFAEISALYDSVNHILSFNLDKKWRKEVARLCVNKSKGGVTPPLLKVLDLCCGTGDQAIEIMKRLQKNSRIYCLDFTKEMLFLARKKFEELQNSCRGEVSSSIIKGGVTPPLQFILGDGFFLPFADNQFDLVTVAFGLRNMDNVVSALKEMNRVIKRGGRLCILEFSNPENKIIKLVYHFCLEKIMAKIGNLITKSKGKAYSYLFASINEWYKAEELREIMSQCGFKNVKIIKKSLGLVAIHIGEKDER